MDFNPYRTFENKYFTKRELGIMKIIAEIFQDARGEDMSEFSHINASYVNPAEFGGEPSKDEKRKILRDAFIKFTNHYDASRIYFSEPLCKKIDDLIGEMMKLTGRFSMFQSRPDMPIGKGGKTPTDMWIEAWEHAEQKVPAAKREIELEFRNILGVAD